MAKKKEMTVEERKLVNSLIEYPENPNKVNESPSEISPVVQEPKTFECEVGAFKAISLLKLPNLGHDSWVSVVLTIQDGQVIDIEMEEPNMKAIAIESSKIEFSKLFLKE